MANKYTNGMHSAHTRPYCTPGSVCVCVLCVFVCAGTAAVYASTQRFIENKTPHCVRRSGAERARCNRNVQCVCVPMSTLFVVIFIVAPLHFNRFRCASKFRIFVYIYLSCLSHLRYAAQNTKSNLLMKSPPSHPRVFPPARKNVRIECVSI